MPAVVSPNVTMPLAPMTTVDAEGAYDVGTIIPASSVNGDGLLIGENDPPAPAYHEPAVAPIPSPTVPNVIVEVGAIEAETTILFILPSRREPPGK